MIPRVSSAAVGRIGRLGVRGNLGCGASYNPCHNVTLLACKQPRDLRRTYASKSRRRHWDVLRIRLGRASCRSSHVRNAPLATVGPLATRAAAGKGEADYTEG
jgi:hypothetical protein